MKLQTFAHGFKLWLSATDTYAWAHRPGESWPCSQLSNKRLFVEFDRNGLCDLAINGRMEDCDSIELSAIVADYLAGKLPVDHPCYFVAVGDGDAHGKLIAAAPSLLAACQAVIRRCENGDTIEPGWHELAQVRAAIDRATLNDAKP